MAPQPTVGALFAGYGGLDLAVQEVWPEAQVSWVSEVDEAPSRILAKRFPDAPNHGDITKIDWSAIEPVDIITGGSPCQDLSHAGKRAGMKDGTRSGLWASMCDAIDIIRPSLVVWENVRGALSAEATAGDVERCEFCVGGDGEPHLRALGRVLGDLAELGYDAAWCGLRAADVGAPHGRWRVFVLAWPAADTDRATGDQWRLAAPGQAQGGRAWADAGGRGGAPDATLLPTPAVNDMGRAYTPEEWDAWTAKMKAAHGNGNGHGKPLEIEAARLMPTPRATDGTKGGPNQRGSSGDLMLPSVVALLPTPSVADVEGGRKSRSGDRSGELLLNGLAAEQRFGDYAPAVERWAHVIGRPAPDPTEPTGKGGAHRLSPRFVEWMMGLPDGWVTDTDTTRNEQLKALGNGVVPQQAAAAIRWLLDAMAAAVAAS